MHIMHILVWIEQRSVVLVLAVFLLLLATTYWPGRKASVERHASLPLEDDR